MSTILFKVYINVIVKRHECQYQTIPEEETGFDLASYRCVCKVGFEYPFGSMKNYFQGATS